MSKTYSYVVMVTIPPKKSHFLTNKILQSRTAACINIIPSLQSYYWWKRKIESAKENLLIIKTTKPKLNSLFNVIRAHHPYSVPEIIALAIVKGHPDYLKFLYNETQS